MSERPSVREALFGNGHVANLWCAVKYVSWQFVHIWMAVMLLTIGLPFIVASKLSLGGRGAWLARGFRHPLAKRAVYYLFFLAGVGGLLVGVVLALAVLVLYPLWFFATIGAFLTGAAVLYGAILVGERYGPSLVEWSSQTPGARRIIGRCPVDMEADPAWFEKLWRRIE